MADNAGPQFGADLGGDLLSAIGDIKGVAKEATAALREASKEAKDSQKELTKFEKDFARAEKNAQKLKDKGQPVGAFMVGKQEFASRSEAVAFQENLIAKTTEASLKASKAEEKKDTAKKAVADNKAATMAKKELNNRFNVMNARVQGVAVTASNILTGRMGLTDAKSIGSGMLSIASSVGGTAVGAKIAAAGTKIAAIATSPTTMALLPAVGAFAGTRLIQNQLQGNLLRQEQEKASTANIMHDFALSQRGRSNQAQQLDNIQRRANRNANEAEQIATAGKWGTRLADKTLTALSGIPFLGSGNTYDFTGITTKRQEAKAIAVREQIASARFGERFSLKEIEKDKRIRLQVERERSTFLGIESSIFGLVADANELTGTGATRAQQIREKAIAEQPERIAATMKAMDLQMKQFNYQPQNRINVLEFNQNLRENEQFRIQKTTAWAAT